MNKIDKLIKAVEELELEPKLGVHIVIDGHCMQCGRECRNINKPGAVIILNDIPQTDTEEELPEDECEVNLNDIPGLNSLTRVEREEVLRELRANPEQLKEIATTQPEYKYQDLFGWG